MLKIIAISGAAGVGKTPTLNCLIDILREKPLTNDSFSHNDHEAVLKINSLTIGIFTAGDTGEIVKGNCEKCRLNKCDIMVTSTRTRGMTKLVLEKEASENGISVCWIKKEIEHNLLKQNAVNEKQAREIKNILTV